MGFFRMGAGVAKRRLFYFLVALLITTAGVYLMHDGSMNPTLVSMGRFSLFNRTLTTIPPQPPIPEPVACIFPYVDIFDPNIMKLAGLDQTPLKCDHDFLPDVTRMDGLVLRVNSSKLKGDLRLRYCRYRNITRQPYKDHSVVYSRWSRKFTKEVKLTDEHEFFQVACYDGKYKNRVVSKAFYSLVPKNKHLESLFNMRIMKRAAEFNPLETLNIVGVALDGLPRHQMIRAMPKTYTHLTERLGSFDFQTHGQVADNTFPNILALLSGFTRAEVNKWWSWKNPEDVFDLLWHDFERAGYRTLYSEDNPRGAGFYWGNRSFMFPQTSYWNRPLELAMLNEPGFIRRKASCAGPRPVAEYQLDYMTRFLDRFPDKPVAGVTFIINLTHDDSTKAVTIDEHIRNFYGTLEAKGHLNRSVVMFFSDHGQRWGKIRQTYNGVVESRNPFLILTFPDWFLKKYPDIARTLRTNTQRLTTHFDTRQTLIDLMYFKGQEPTPPHRGRHGISLFREIPASRTCEAASIPWDQCLCGQGVEKFLDTNSSEAKALAEALLRAVQSRSEPAQCETYRLDQLLQVGALSLPTAWTKEKKRFMVASVRLTVQPGGAMFEATVNMNLNTNETSVGSKIERLNMYKGEVECRPTSLEQMFCYCKGNKEMLKQ
ncbi:hypothetical protein EGW08_000728 [Elysia chlorotica]|uniref:Uncharacterized protein n=1 Tax=Elysia chlorotica TaxID=188477 RepID=A0A3S1I3E9_ELYCH|nr:hypothetical protein EGW08_000728 [Elysia chlorotica]